MLAPGGPYYEIYVAESGVVAYDEHGRMVLELSSLEVGLYAALDLVGESCHQIHVVKS